MIRSGREDHLRLLAAVAVPGLAVVLVRFLGSGVGGASADVALPEAAPVPTFSAQGPNVPEAAAACLRRASELSAAAVPASPFVIPPSSAAGSSGDRPARPADGQPTPPGLHLGAIYVADQRPIAVIDGRLRRIGHRVAEAWTLVGIDPAVQTVTLRHDSGAIATLRLHQLDAYGGR